MRDVTQLHPELQKKLKELVKLCEKNKLKIGISECLRSVAEQDALYAQGRTKPGKIVTNARGSNYSSMHQWGVAFDFYRNDGKGAYNNSGHFFEKVGALGQSIGLEWGGSWKSIKDMPHFQLPDWGSTASKLKLMYIEPAHFFKTWPNGGKAPSPTKKAKTLTVTAKGGLKLRQKPTTLSKTITVMPQEAIFTPTGEEKNGFKKGTYGKKMGWASAKYLG